MSATALAVRAEDSPRIAPDPERRRRYRGCLLGGAVGDALGAPVEFMSRAEIVETFGADGIVDYTTAFDRRGAITDDTQMTLFTAEGLLRAHVREATDGSAPIAAMLGDAYLRWLHTQGYASPRTAEIPLDGHLLGQKALHAQRVPGATCLQALSAMREPAAKARNDSKGCGGVMRVAAVGLFCAREPGASLDRATRRAFDLGVEAAALTHGHPTGQLTAGVLAALVALLVRGLSLPDALARTKPICARRPLSTETLRAIEKAERLAATGEPSADKVASLGEGWVAEEALAVGLYAALVAREFVDGVLLAINHDGDSDSTGSIAGNVLGALRGVDAIPRRWLSGLELGETIASVADDLATYPDWPIGQFMPASSATSYWMERYPPG